ncbi:MAG: HAD family hydrolase [Candidatus Paceibacterota bacterium]
MKKKGRIVIFDLMETIVSGGGIYPIVKRIGLDEFLDKNSDCRFVIATTSGSILTKEESIKEVEFYLEQIGIKNRISKIYYGWDMTRGIKDLAKIAKDFDVKISDLVFIGDNDRDEDSAEYFGVKFIKVPAIFRDIIKVSNPSNPETYLLDYMRAPHKFSFENLEI